MTSPARESIQFNSIRHPVHLVRTGTTWTQLTLTLRSLCTGLKVIGSTTMRSDLPQSSRWSRGFPTNNKVSSPPSVNSNASWVKYFSCWLCRWEIRVPLLLLRQLLRSSLWLLSLHRYPFWLSHQFRHLTSPAWHGFPGSLRVTPLSWSSVGCILRCRLEMQDADRQSLILIYRMVAPRTGCLFLPLSIHWAHTSLLSCHTGIKRTCFVIKQRFWWPAMEKEVGE